MPDVLDLLVDGLDGWVGRQQLDESLDVGLVVLIGQQLDLIRIVCLAGEAEFLDQDAVGIILVVYQRRSRNNMILQSFKDAFRRWLSMAANHRIGVLMDIYSYNNA